MLYANLEYQNCNIRSKNKFLIDVKVGDPAEKIRLGIEDRYKNVYII